MNPKNKAFIELIVATFFFSLFGIFTRLLASDLGVFLQLMLRVGLMAGIFGAIGALTKIYKRIRPQDLPLFVFRGFLIIADFSCFYVAVNNLPLGLTLFIFYSASVIMSFSFGAIFLKEKLDLTKVIGISTAIVGLSVMYSESFHGVTLWPSLAAFGSGACFGLTVSTSKKLTDKYDTTQVNLVAYLVSFVLAIPLLLLSREAIPTAVSPMTIVELIGFALVGVAAFYLTVDGFKYLEAQKASLILLAELVFVVILGWLLYSEIPTMRTVIGGLLILVALALPNLNLKHWKSSVFR
ncbi:MAG: DMT family transporter [Candidatus Moraniibacteriota bacterium]